MRTFSTISSAARFLPGISKLQYYVTADIFHFKFFFYSDTAPWKMAVNFKLVLESPTNSTYSSHSGSFSIRTSVICALSLKRSMKKRNCLSVFTTVSFALLNCTN